MNFDLANKVAIVTGAAKGIGREIALALAQSGAVVIVADIDEKLAKKTAEEITSMTETTVVGLAVDVSEIEQLKAMTDSVYKDFGSIDILVNNAGVLDNSLIEELEEPLWDKVIDINLKSVFFASKYAFEYMKKQKSGHIINISSVAGRMGGHSVGCAYAASKGGIISMTMNFARKCAAYGISVNSVAPGTIASDMSDAFTADQIERLYANIPMGRLGQASEIAAAVVFLSSGKSDFITGSVIDVNGGMHMA